nr:MAG TPA: hypothetical protein [Caudoviricetes sp.]
MLNLYRYFSEQRLKFQFLRRLREQRCALDGCRSEAVVRSSCFTRARS